MNLKVKGLDIGYTYTKDDDKRIFKSAMTQIDTGITGGNKIVVDNKTSWVGVGNGTVDADKSNLELTKMCMITNLAMDTADEFYIVTGLPIGQYSTQKDKLRKSLLSCNGTRVNYNGIDKIIKINDMMVYPQCAGVLLSSGIKEDIIVVDIGGHTIDVGYFSYNGNGFNLEKSDTWYQGMLIVYGKVINAINNHFGLTLEPIFAEHIINNGLFIHGKKQDIGFINIVLQEHLQPIYDELSLHYPSKVVPFALCGGGSVSLQNTFTHEFPNTCMIEDSQFANAKGFKKFGDKKFGNLIYANQLQHQRSSSYAK